MFTLYYTNQYKIFLSITIKKNYLLNDVPLFSFTCILIVSTFNAVNRIKYVFLNNF